MTSIRQQFMSLRDRSVTGLEGLADLLSDLYQGAEAASVTDLPSNMRDRAGRLRREEFVVVVTGEMKRGKSTFLNALLGRDVFASDTDEASATVAFMRHVSASPDASLHNRAQVHFIAGGQPETINLEQLSHYTSRQSPKGEEFVTANIDHVDVFVESPFVEDGVLLVDTPGTNTTNQLHIRITANQIERSNAAIFLLGANTGCTATDIQALKDMSATIQHFFFVVNRIDELPPDAQPRQLASVAQKLLRELGNGRDRQLKVYGTSALKALLARDHREIIPVSLMNRMAEPDYRGQFLAESGFQEFEADLLRYLFQGGKSHDLIWSQVTFMRHQCDAANNFLSQQEDVLAGRFDFAALEHEEAELSRVVADRKVELERSSDELVARLGEALQQGLEEVTARLDLEEENLKNHLGNYKTAASIANNWDKNDELASYPARRMDVVVRKAGQVLKSLVQGVLEAEHRKIRGQLAGALDKLDGFKLPELVPLTIEFEPPTLSDEEAQQLDALRIQCADLESQLMRAGSGVPLAEDESRRKRQELEELKQEKMRLLQLLGSRPDAIRIQKPTVNFEKRGGFLGGLTSLLVGDRRVDGVETFVDRDDQNHYDRQRAAIENDFRAREQEAERRVEAASAKLSLEQQEKYKRDAAAELMKRREAQLEKLEAQYKDKLARADQEAVDASRKRLLAWFRGAREDVEQAFAQLVRDRREAARAFIDEISEQLDDQVQGAQARLAHLRSLKATKETERAEQEARLAALRSRLEEHKRRTAELADAVSEHFKGLQTKGEGQHDVVIA
jgi:GTP-binding protein EngB required for normal cell division